MIPLVPAFIVGVLGSIITINVAYLFEVTITKPGVFIKNVLEWIGKHTIVIMALHFAVYRIFCSLRAGFIVSQLLMWIVIVFSSILFEYKFFKVFVGKE